MMSCIKTGLALALAVVSSPPASADCFEKALETGTRLGQSLCTQAKAAEAAGSPIVLYTYCGKCVVKCPGGQPFDDSDSEWCKYFLDGTFKDDCAGHFVGDPWLPFESSGPLPLSEIRKRFEHACEGQ